MLIVLYVSLEGSQYFLSFRLGCVWILKHMGVQDHVYDLRKRHLFSLLLFDDFSLLQVLHLFYLPKIKSPKVFCLGATTLIQRLHLGCQFLLGKLERNLILSTF